MHRIRARLVSLRRATGAVVRPHNALPLASGDTLVLSGLPESLAKNAQNIRWFGLLALMAQYNVVHAVPAEEKK